MWQISLVTAKEKRLPGITLSLAHCLSLLHPILPEIHTVLVYKHHFHFLMRELSINSHYYSALTLSAPHKSSIQTFLSSSQRVTRKQTETQCKSTGAYAYTPPLPKQRKHWPRNTLSCVSVSENQIPQASNWTHLSSQQIVINCFFCFKKKKKKETLNRIPVTSQGMRCLWWEGLKNWRIPETVDTDLSETRTLTQEKNKALA